MVHGLTRRLAGHLAGERSRGVTRREQLNFFLMVRSLSLIRWAWG